MWGVTAVAKGSLHRKRSALPDLLLEDAREPGIEAIQYWNLLPGGGTIAAREVRAGESEVGDRIRRIDPERSLEDRLRGLGAIFGEERPAE
jgi:hypothetical protein